MVFVSEDIMLLALINMYHDRLTIIFIIMINIGSFNIHGINDTKWSYLRHCMSNCEFMLIQEHWLHSSKFHMFSDNIDNIGSHCISGMDDSVLISGRPYGGCAILWKNALSCIVEPLTVSSKRLCAVKEEIGSFKFILCTVYIYALRYRM